ncbi:MAG: DUF1761 domain-containing protein [Bacteroidia bacterium]
MTPNLLFIVVAALVPMVIGFIWYSPKVLGNAWMDAAGMTKEKVEGGNMPLIFGLSFVFAIMLAFGMFFLTVHQTHVFSLLMENQEAFDSFMATYGEDHRTFGHGAFHGFVDGILIALPILATNALFERKGTKYIAVNGGYWILTLALMGGVLCAWA